MPIASRFHPLPECPKSGHSAKSGHSRAIHPLTMAWLRGEDPPAHQYSTRYTRAATSWNMSARSDAEYCVVSRLNALYITV